VMQQLCLAIVAFPLLGALVAGLGGSVIGRKGAHWVTTSSVAIAFFLSLIPFWNIVFGDQHSYNENVYKWLSAGGVDFYVGFLVDELSATMMVVVTFVSWMVHVYTIGYMRDDPSYQRFFAYISLFTFSMLMLVMANNFLQLFFGWEAVGLVSYLLIGFWFKKPSAIHANLKAFLVNRVGDFGFLLGIAGVLMYLGSLDYQTAFNGIEQIRFETVQIPGIGGCSLPTLLALLLFVGAMGKSAQVPLHVWLPDSMEGPTPISALIHAATMVTAGIFMVARMSPIFELSETALSTIVIIGAATAFLMGVLGLVQNDIKRVVAYSTLSQLGYMTVALGVSAYSAAIFHLFTHAFFKALLFLAAGSVIMGMHHEQDMRKMGGLKNRMPVTYWTLLLGSLALIGFPGFSGFFSKDAIIEAVHLSSLPGAGVAYVAIIGGVFVTALYSFRLVFMVFHGEPRMDSKTLGHIEESPKVVTVPLIVLAVPSVMIGALFVSSMLFGEFFGDSIVVAIEHDVLKELGQSYNGAFAMVLHGLLMPPFWLATGGVLVAWYLYLKRPDLPKVCADKLSIVRKVLEEKYGFDRFNEWFFARGARALGNLLWKTGDVRLIDGWIVNGTAQAVGLWAGIIRHIQSGYLYHYAFAMIIGLLSMLAFFVY
jgi:NADH-quinone oxidoreductase subunit L